MMLYFKNRPNRIFSGVVILIMTGIFSVVLAQPAAKQGENITAGQNGKDDSVHKVALKMENAQASMIMDSRIQVYNVNFDRRFASTGQGEFLDVVFEMNNLTDERLDIVAWVFAYYEQNVVDQNQRRFIPYPTWRPHDPEKSTYLIKNIAITPVNIDPGALWNKDEEEYKNYERVVNRIQNSVTSTRPVGKIYPPAYKYVSYIINNPKDGLAIRLYGDQGPGQHEVLQSNYIPPTPEEKRLKMHKTLPQHSYTIEYSPRHTAVRTHHYSKFRNNYTFYNMVTVLLFDAKKLEKANEPKGNNPAESKDTNPLLYYQTFKIAKPIKVY